MRLYLKILKAILREIKHIYICFAYTLNIYVDAYIYLYIHIYAHKCTHIYIPIYVCVYLYTSGSVFSDYSRGTWRTTHCAGDQTWVISVQVRHLNLFTISLALKTFCFFWYQVCISHSSGFRENSIEKYIAPGTWNFCSGRGER